MAGVKRWEVGLSAAGATLAALGIGLGVPSHAAEFTYSPLARAVMRLDDNIRGSSVDQESAWGFDVGGGVLLKAQTEALKSELTPRFNVRRFIVGDDLDTEEYSVNANNDWLQERYALGLDVSYARDSTLTAEATDSGRRNDVKDRDTVALSPSASWYVTDRLTATGTFFFTDVAYLDAANTGLVDYDYMQASTGASYLWRENAQVFASFFVSQFRTPDLDGKTLSFGGQTGMTWRWSETLETTGSLGWIASDIEFVQQELAIAVDPLPRVVVLDVPSEASASGPIAAVSIRKEFETVEAKFDYTRQVSPSGRGSQSTADRIALNLKKRLSDRLSLLFDGLHEIRTAEGDLQIRDLNRDYSELRGTVRYRVTRELVALASYRFGHRQSTSGTSDNTADSNSVFLTLVLTGMPKKLWSSM